ncbi:MAG: C25 family cysteine peptidase [Chryseolinea sp.]
MRLFYWGTIFLLFTLPAFGQNGQEWIIYSQQYFKIPVATEGIFRLSGTALMAAGVPAGTNPQNLQLFHRGMEQAILVNGQQDGTLDAVDYLEFYGKRNDGTLDAELYKPASAQPHGFYNLFSDTTAYFLTIGSIQGKRMQVFPGSYPNGAITEKYIVDEKLIINASQYSGGIDINEIQSTNFETGEGWTGDQLTQGQSVTYTHQDISLTEPTGGLPVVEVLLVGRGPMAHYAELRVGASGRQAATATFSGFDSYKLIQPIQWSDIAADGSLQVTIRCAGQGGGADRISTSYIKVTYPRKPDLQQNPHRIFYMPKAVGGISYLKLANALAGQRLYDITDADEPGQMGTASGTQLAATIESTTVRRLMVINSWITPIIKSVSFRKIFPAQKNYIIISNPLLRKPAMGYADPALAYASYRGSPEGGSYDTLLVNVQELFDQFNYGESSPLAIFHFMKFLTSVKVPKYLLLLGKGLDVNYQFYRLPASFTKYKDFVPSAGYPAADMVFTAGLAGTTYEPAVPTGRVPAVSADDIAHYLNKVKEMEALPYNDLWRKNIVHLSGGIYEGEPQQFKLYMQDFQAVAEDAYLGGKVSALAKHSKEIQLINIAQQVNSGLNLITFFGHASPTLLDFELGYVTDPIHGYNNKGKYPTLLMNGCQVGAFFLPYTLFGEDWLVARDKGAIGFIAHSGYGFIGPLRRYSQTFYEVGYQNPAFVGKGLGDIQKETAKRYMTDASASASNITQVQQMVLLGDPAVALFGAKKPDLEINESNVTFQSYTGGPINAFSDSFAVNIIIRNFGLATKDTVRVEILRTLNDNSTIRYDSLIPVTKYSDTLTFNIKKGQSSEFGNNTFRVTIDPDNVLDEYKKENNVASKALFISLSGTQNLYPSDFAIVNTTALNLSFQSTDVLSGEREFIVELDTINSFDSPYKKMWSTRGNVLARQQINLPEGDTLAYYWRTRLADPFPGESDSWTQSSFTYIQHGATGWAQVHFPQYLQDASQGLIKDEELRRLSFSKSVQRVSVSTFGSQYPGFYEATSIKISNVEYFASFPGFECRSNTMNLVAFDRKSTVPYLGVKLEWFNRAGRTCGRDPIVINNYQYNEMVTGSDSDLIAYIDNIETGDSVVLFSIGNAYFSLWPEAARVKLGEFGISTAQINLLEDNEPVVIFGRKGASPGSASITTSATQPKAQQGVSIDKSITGGFTSGYLRSSWIGPAIEWDSLLVNTTEKTSVDVVTFNVVGIKVTGEELMLFDDVTVNQDLSSINAAIYPYIRISFNTQDDTFLTSAQLRKWLVTFTPGPEGLLLYDGIHHQEKIVEGDVWHGRYRFVNISDKQFSDSLTVRYEIFNQDKHTSDHGMLKVNAPLPGDTTAIAIDVGTFGKEGINDVDVFVNPRLIAEQYYENNFLQLNEHLHVTGDSFHPVLDVSVDGRKLVNGDFVSTEPQILIKLWDENRFILKKDTAGIRIFLTYPCADAPCAPTQIVLSGKSIEWSSATDTSAFKVDFRPAALADGNYKLRVEGADALGNQSGLLPYEIEFSIKGETTIEISEPYPNPFSRRVYFDVVISGGIPDAFEMELVNVNGQREQHYTASDLGAFHVGTNVLSWDGTGYAGDALSNGVYIYRIDVVIEGKHVRKVGKLVLVR